MGSGSYVESGYYENLSKTPSIQNLGLEHFYAAFGLGCSRNLRNSAALTLDIGESSISEDCVHCNFLKFVGDLQSTEKPMQHEALVILTEMLRQIWLTWKEQG